MAANYNTKLEKAEVGGQGGVGCGINVYLYLEPVLTRYTWFGGDIPHCVPAGNKTYSLQFQCQFLIPKISWRASQEVFVWLLEHRAREPSAPWTFPGGG